MVFRCICQHPPHIRRRRGSPSTAGGRRSDGALSNLRRSTMASGPVRRRRRCSAWPTGLSAAKIEALLHKWFGRLPHPFAARDRRAGYRYCCSILQSEFSLTQTLDQPVMGRVFFEEVIRENLDVGRPDQVQLIFGRRVSRRTPGRFRTRVITEGVTPSLYI